MWIARDKGGELYAYKHKPQRDDRYFFVQDEYADDPDEYWVIGRECYPEVTWENSPKELVVKEESV